MGWWGAYPVASARTGPRIIYPWAGAPWFGASLGQVLWIIYPGVRVKRMTMLSQGRLGQVLRIIHPRAGPPKGLEITGAHSDRSSDHLSVGEPLTPKTNPVLV